MAVAETVVALTETGSRIAAVRESVCATLREFVPWDCVDAMHWGLRQHRLKEKYGRWGAILPKKWNEIPAEFLKALEALRPDVLDQCHELLWFGLERKAIRLAYCGKLGRIYRCSVCERPAKKIAGCKLAMCLACAKKNFDRLFGKYLQVEGLIPASVRSLPGWTWNVLDFSFRHDGYFPTRWELRAMVRVIRRTVVRAVIEACQEWYDARKGCCLRFLDDLPQMSDGWPVVSAKDGSTRVLKGWTVFHLPEHEAPDNKARKEGRRGVWKLIPARWVLRFGYEFIRVREFGFDNVNAHFHGAYFGPRLDYWGNKDGGRLVCGGRLVEIFKEESRRALGKESYTVFFQEARKGFGSVLAHALKYTEKLPASTPEKLAELEFVMQGTRRVALLGAHYGVPLKLQPRDPRCPSCGSVMGAVVGLGLVPLAEIEDLPEVEETECVEGWKGDASCFYEPDEVAAHAPRAP